MKHQLKTVASKVTAQIVVRDKDGNVKYQGPLVMDAVHVEEKDSGDNAPDRS